MLTAVAVRRDVIDPDPRPLPLRPVRPVFPGLTERDRCTVSLLRAAGYDGAVSWSRDNDKVLSVDTAAGTVEARRLEDASDDCCSLRRSDRQASGRGSNN